MERRTQGRSVEISTVGEVARAFVPNGLPPIPPIDWSVPLRTRFDRAHLQLGRLDSVSQLLPNRDLFLYMYVRKEAVYSSMIEGTQSSLSDLLLYELEERPGVPVDDVEEVCQYVAALNHGLFMLSTGLPLSSRLIKSVHHVLLCHGRGQQQTPGEYRRIQNWIGGPRPSMASFVPPPPHEVGECMSQLEKFLNDVDETTPPLLKAALAHVQFETIHPFLDGNGRLGRLLILLILADAKILSIPLLYISLYFKVHRTYYYDLLNRVRQTGDWEAWLAFFAEAVEMTAAQAVETIHLLNELVRQDQVTIGTLGRAASSCLRVHHALTASPITNTRKLVKQTGLTAATVNTALAKLCKLGLVYEATEKRRNRLFFYEKYLKIMEQGPDPLPGAPQ